MHQPFHDGATYHIETSPFICRPNQLSGFHITGASVIKELRSHMSLPSYKKVSIAKDESIFEDFAEKLQRKYFNLATLIFLVSNGIILF